MTPKLKIIPLGGLGEIGKNMTVVEFGNDLIIIDCGMGFPDEDMYGIDVVLPDSEANAFAEAITAAKRDVRQCRICRNYTDREVCPICASDRRDRSLICVVSDPKDVLSIERAREYNGLYHVLHGVISPMNHIGPDDIGVKELLMRAADDEVQEVIMATNPDTEGEATAMYIARLLRPFGIKVTRLGFGVPVGSNLEYADDATMLKALEGRREM